jgi:hypothetical protein
MAIVARSVKNVFAGPLTRAYIPYPPTTGLEGTVSDSVARIGRVCVPAKCWSAERRGSDLEPGRTFFHLSEQFLEAGPAGGLRTLTSDVADRSSRRRRPCRPASVVAIRAPGAGRSAAWVRAGFRTPDAQAERRNRIPCPATFRFGHRTSRVRVSVSGGNTLRPRTGRRRHRDRPVRAYRHDVAVASGGSWCSARAG